MLPLPFVPSPEPPRTRGGSGTGVSEAPNLCGLEHAETPAPSPGGSTARGVTGAFPGAVLADPSRAGIIGPCEKRNPES